MLLTEKTLRIKQLSQDVYKYQKKVSKRTETFMLKPKKGHQLNNALANHNTELRILEDLKKELKELVKQL